MKRKRNFGLDIIRSNAIILVLIAHLAPFFNYYPILYNFLYHAGLYGVELFFVLSGFLIGQILIKKILPDVSFQKIKVFYIRRWLRTLPIYYLVLIILVCLYYINHLTQSLHIFHFIFLQNLIKSEEGFFGVSWTLSVEEWFYLFLPILFLCFLLNKPTYKKILRVLFLSIIAIIVLRMIYVYFFNPTFDFGVRKFIPLRFDSLLIGVLFASIKLGWHSLYRRLCNFSSLFLSMIILGIYYVIYVYLFINYSIVFFDKSFFFRVLSFPLISVLFGFVIINLENNHYVNQILSQNRYVNSFFTKMSLYSYSIYLIHAEIYGYFQQSLKLSNNILGLIISTTIIIIVAGLLYGFVEKRFMAIRDKFFKN